MPQLHVNEIDIYYEVAGSGEPLVFIHGLGSSAADWEAQVKYFSQFYKGITFDVRGHGKTSKPQTNYSISQFAAELGQLCQENERKGGSSIGQL
jgi:pimeloyl-ACP methyl ester carboxylesterase